jgi:hypothetical protein
MVSPPDFFLGVILMAATLARRKTAGLGVGFPTALFSGGRGVEKNVLVHNSFDTQ